MPLPFGLKLKRTRRYTVSSKSCLVTRIQLLNGEFVEYTLSVEGTGQECLEAVAQRLELREVSIVLKCYSWTESLFRPHVMTELSCLLFGYRKWMSKVMMWSVLYLSTIMGLMMGHDSCTAWMHTPNSLHCLFDFVLQSDKDVWKWMSYTLNWCVWIQENVKYLLDELDTQCKDEMHLVKCEIISMWTCFLDLLSFLRTGGIISSCLCILDVLISFILKSYRTSKQKSDELLCIF